MPVRRGDLRHRIAGALAAAAAAFAVAGCVNAPTPPDDPRAVRLSAAQAIAAFASFAPDTTGLSADGPTEGFFHRIYHIDGAAGVTGSVDAFDGTVISYLSGHLPTSNVVVLTAAEAEAKARAFLADHRINVDGMTVTVELIDHGETKEYRVDLQRYAGDVRLPDARFASVDPAKGAVFGYGDAHRPYAPPPPALISRGEAISKAGTASGLAEPSIDSVALAVAFDGGRQMLVWEIALTSGIEHALVRVDALTGAATIVGRG